MKDNKKNISFMERLATFIVDKRKGFILGYCIMIVFSVFSRSWVKVNNDITTYLPSTTETRQGLTIMEDEFITYGRASVMISNITYSKAEALCEKLKEIEGVSEIEFENDLDHYKSASALFNITFDGEESAEITKNSMNKVIDSIQDYDYYISSEINKDTAASLAKEISSVLVIAIFIILGVLLFTSKTYMEIPVLMITFGVAALLNMGTNFLYGEISFVSNSISSVLQLALAIDYAIILCHRFTEERINLQAREATIKALSKAIPEISSSSLTTISGLMALMCMQFSLGFDMGIVLIKALLFSLLTVFTLMPGLLMMFSKGMDKTKHKNFVPSINIWGKIVVKTRYIVPPIFIAIIVVSFVLSSRCNYVFGFSTLKTKKQNETQIAEKKITDTFSTNNMLAIIVPSGDYEKEGLLIKDLEELEVTDFALGLANIDALDDYVLTDSLTTRQFAELTDLDIEVSRLLYSAYAVNNELYGRVINGLDNYKVPLIDMINFLNEQKNQGYVNLNKDLNDKFDDLYEQLNRAQLQLKGENYSRILLGVDTAEEGEETFKLLDTIHKISGKYYDKTIIAGESTSANDLATFFSTDNLIIGILSALFVMTVLLFTFKSAGIPVLLVLTIQGSIWINFSFPSLTNTNIYFLSYLVVTSIQMGATIDYAIVITSRYMELKQVMSLKDAMIQSLNQAFPTIITSSTILASAGLLIGQLSSDYAISSIGVCLGRGTIISLILVMGVLPQTLLLGDFLIEKTAFTIKRPSRVVSYTGNMKVNGRVRGYVSGVIDADINGSIKGDITAIVESKNIKNRKELPAEFVQKEVSDEEA
ncbi:efflux RND transporter permease subunit [Oceanirhabdus sp. W0125-5]|uniref:efflux RND transporter permease subunit n=1 Tax=Oceanirhabdus sp. W0125-5 TaxID=2999116 RepID=UPI0022F2C8C0|nr:MMPL family transporter [Oceanirhabdus sp. W0125-5]WBW98874.1 MMPL family transporter [Oceanirhabdus sp. W0125-5]